MKIIKFTQRENFYSELKNSVEKYFQEKQIKKTGNRQMFLKTIIIFIWLLSSYTALVFFSHSILVSLVLIFLLSQAFVLVGFNIQHDANHGSYSQNKKINTLLGFTLDLIGGSSWVWRTKHNILHHTYTNISELDSDINTNGLMRLSPAQPWRVWHRWQHLYALPLYSLMSLSWIFYGDMRRFFLNKINDYQLPKPRLYDVIIFFTSKFSYFGYMLVLPSFFHPLWQVLIAFIAIHLILGLTLALVFQLAHIVEGNEFPIIAKNKQLPTEWAIHEIKTTANFANQNKIATWYLGGLNFQIEHHLFSRICHIHYPQLQQFVQATCKKFNLQYLSYRSFIHALLAHFRLLKQLSQPT